MKKIKFLIIALSLSVIITIFFFELVTFFLYNITNIKYFENFEEAKIRKSESYVNYYFNKNELKKSKKIKIAIFGGSIATGYALPSNYSQILKKLNYNELIVHNYSENGGAFSGYQSEIIEILIPFYDYIIVYSGDNELWPYLCSKSIANNKDIILPNNFTINSNCRDSHDLKIKKLSKIFNSEQSRINQLYDFILLKSRFVFFTERFIFQFSNFFKKKDKLEKNNYKIPFYLSNSIISNSEKKHININFQESMNRILKLKKKHQTLIVVSPISNDLTPPTFDILENKERKLKKKIIDITKENYRKILNYEYNNVSLDIKSHNSHQLYFKGMKCIGDSKKISKECFKYLELSRNKDKFPLRISSEIKQYINGLKQHNNVKVINITPILMQSKTIQEFNSYFIDVQHISLKSHLLILKEILKIIYPNEEYLQIKYENELCDKFSLFWKKKKIDISFRKNILKNSLDISKSWINSISLQSDHKYNLNYFIKLNLYKEKKCL